MSYLLTWAGVALGGAGKRSDFQVEPFPKKALADAALKSLELNNLERSGVVVSQPNDLEGSGGAFLINVFNMLTGKDQKSFHDLPTARKQVFEAMQAKYPAPEGDTETPTDLAETELTTDLSAPTTVADTTEGTTPEATVNQENDTMATKKVTKSKKPTKTPKAAKTNGGPKKPGVIDAIVAALEGKGGTINAIAEKVAKKFPDRDAEGIKATVKIQVNRLQKSKEDGGRNLKIQSEQAGEGSNEKRYWTK